MKLSIIIPVYRAEDTLERCIGSILQQSFTSYELILVDDGSPDACPQLCDEYAGKDSRIHVIHKENGGLSDARNVGIKRAKGLYITFIDSDDAIGENSLQHLMEELYQHPDVDILEYPIMERIGHPHREKLLSFSPKTYQNAIEYWWAEKGYHHTYACNKIFRRSLFQKYIPASFSSYIEPFLGGGAVFFHLEPKQAIINDVNSRLIAFYECVRNHYDDMRTELDLIQELYERNQADYKVRKALAPDERVPNANEALYYRIRDMYNGKIPAEYLDGVLYFFINKTAYSGMIRFNSNGEYNVPFGRYPNLNTKLITQEHSQLLQRAEVLQEDYSVVFERAQADDFMFLDPPYDCVFNDYGNIDMMNGFDEEEHRRLAADFRNLSCRALMVIGKTPLTEELYGKFIKDEYCKNYAVNIRNRFKNDAKHIVVMNY